MQMKTIGYIMEWDVFSTVPGICFIFCPLPPQYESWKAFWLYFCLMLYKVLLFSLWQHFTEFQTKIYQRNNKGLQWDFTVILLAALSLLYITMDKYSHSDCIMILGLTLQCIYSGCNTSVNVIKKTIVDIASHQYLMQTLRLSIACFA